MPTSIEKQQYDVLLSIDATLKALLLYVQQPTEHDPALPLILAAIQAQTVVLQTIADDLAPEPTFPTAIAFTETKMVPTEAGQTQVFTGTLSPSGATYPADTTFTLTSNDTAVTPTVDATGLIVSVTYPSGWVESTTTPLAFSYTAASVSAAASISATITPSAPPVAFPTGVVFSQTT
jgi:hypothetical protein